MSIIIEALQTLNRRRKNMEERTAKYEKLKLIGAGMFGKAWLVRSRPSRRSYVIKEIEVSGMTSQEMAQAVNEVAILSRLKHKNVIRYREAFTSASTLHIVMEFADQGDLAQQIELRRREVGRGFPENQALDWTVQICFALSYIHDLKILHRDLKPANIFLTSSRILKVGDFGIAKILENTLDHAQTAIGTPYYLSPEICRSKPYNQKSDMWALGCVLYQLVTLQHPFQAKDFSNLVVNILSGIYPSVPSDYSLLVSDLVSVLLRVNPERRPTALQILKVPKLRQHVTSYTNRKNESLTSLPTSTKNHPVVKEEQKVRVRLGGISNMADVRETETMRTSGTRRKSDKIDESKQDSCGLTAPVSERMDAELGVNDKEVTLICNSDGKQDHGKDKPRSYDTTSSCRRSEDVSAKRVRKPSQRSVDRRASRIVDDNPKATVCDSPSHSVKRRRMEDTNKVPSVDGTRRSHPRRRPKCHSVSDLKSVPTGNLGVKIVCRKTYILHKRDNSLRGHHDLVTRASGSLGGADRAVTRRGNSANTDERDFSTNRTKKCEGDGELPTSTKCSFSNVKHGTDETMQSKKTGFHIQLTTLQGQTGQSCTRERQVVSCDETVVPVNSYTTITPDRTLEIAEVMHAGTPTADEDTGSVRGRLESLRDYLEEKLGTVKCVDAFGCLEETTESKRLVQLMNDRIGSSDMRYFPMLLQVWDLENRCH